MAALLRNRQIQPPIAIVVTHRSPALATINRQFALLAREGMKPPWPSPSAKVHARHHGAAFQVGLRKFWAKNVLQAIAATISHTGRKLG